MPQLRLIFYPFLLTLLLFTSGCQFFSGEYEYNGSLIDPPLPVPDFQLATADDQTFQLSSAKDDAVLVFFGYTFCPDVCPLTLADVKTALADFENRERVTVLFISVDPERDTPEVVQQYVTSFDPDFIGLTDDYDKIQDVMLPFGAYAEKEVVSESAAGYLVNHTARLYLLRPGDHQLMLTYPFGFEAEDLRSDLAHLLQPES